MDITFIAWASGIIDGEGCIRAAKRKALHRYGERSPRYTWYLQVKMIHKPTIELLLKDFNVGTIRREMPGKLNKRIAWVWSVSGEEMVMVLKAVLPYLVTKRDEALAMLAFRKSYVPTIAVKKRVLAESLAVRENLYQTLRGLKLREWK